MALVAVVGLAPVIAPYDPHALEDDSLETPTATHLLGTNDIGQDLLSQLIWGARAALIVAGAGAATVVRGFMGTGRRAAGGNRRQVVMRAMDTFMPGLPLMPLLRAAKAPGSGPFQCW